MADILDVKGLNVERVETEEGDRIVNVEAHGKGRDKVGSHLEGVGALGELARPKLNALVLDVHANLKLAVVDEGGVACDERSVSGYFGWPRIRLTSRWPS